VERRYQLHKASSGTGTEGGSHGIINGAKVTVGASLALEKAAKNKTWPTASGHLKKGGRAVLVGQSMPGQT